MTTRNQDPPPKSDLFFPYETPTTTGVSFDPAHHTASSEHPPAYVAQDENFSFFDFARAFNSAAASAATNTSEDTIGSTPLMYPSMHGQAHLSPTSVQEEEPFLFHGDFKTEERPQRCLDDLLFASSAPADESPTSISTAFGWPSLSTPQSIAPRHMMGPEEEENLKEHAASTTHAPTVVCGVNQQQELTHSSVFGASRNYPQQENRHEPPHSDIPLRMKHAVDSVDQYEKVPPSSLLQKKPTVNKERAILRAQDVNVEFSQETESGLPITSPCATSFAQTSEFCRMASTTTEHPIQHGTEAIEVEAGAPSTSVSDLSSSATKSIRRKPIPNGHRDDTTNPSSGTLQMNHLLHIGVGSEVEHVLGELYDAVQQADSMLSTPFPPPGVGQKLSRSTSQIEEPVNESVPLTSVTTQPGGMEYVPLRRCQELMDRIDKSMEEMRTLTAEIVRTTTDLLQRCASPNLKLQGYSAAKTLKAQVSDIWQQIDAYEGRA